MGKAKRSINPADAARKAQRKRELKKNKDDRKRARENALSKRDTGRTKQEITRLETLARQNQLDKSGQARLTSLREDVEKIEKAKKSQGLTGATAALAARQKQQQQQQETRKLVFDPKSGAFIPAKIKKRSSEQAGYDGQEGEDSMSSEADSGSGSGSGSGSDSDEESDSDSDSDGEDVGDVDIPMPEGPPPSLTTKDSKQDNATDNESDEDIPLPPGPPPPRPFQAQFQPFQGHHHGLPLLLPPSVPLPFLPPPHAYYGMPHYPPPMMMPPPSTGKPNYYHSMHSSSRSHDASTRGRPSRTHHQYVRARQIDPMLRDIQPAEETEDALEALERTLLEEDNVSSTAYSLPPAHSASPAVYAPTATISAEPQLRDLQKELLGFVPAALRRKQAASNKAASLPKGARPTINAAPEVEDGQDMF
ncbi:WW domain binding protein 11-domain-containing protein [Spinellus fusiger]|nr:WW domain binding protein 11-domain-containing protein [Spinellus fusiger]